MVMSKQNKAISLFLISILVSMGRHCKLAIQQACDTTLVDWNQMLLPEWMVINFNKSIESQWNNGPMGKASYDGSFLMRFLVDGKLYITDDSSPRLQLSRLMMENIHKEVIIDFMFINEGTTMWHSLPEQGHMNGAKSYNPTGHYPILAGFDSCGKEVYVARDSEVSEDPVACVTSGDSTIQFEGWNGKPMKSSSFWVLGLRQNPSDMYPPYPCAPEGAVDSTGPLHWLAFWPTKDSDFPTEFQNQKILGLLDNLDLFLNTLLQSANIGDSEQEQKGKFCDTLSATEPGEDDLWFWCGHKNCVCCFRYLELDEEDE